MESWSFLGRVLRREVMARASMTETMDSDWGSDFHSNSVSLAPASSSSIVPLLSIFQGFVSCFCFVLSPSLHFNQSNLSDLSMNDVVEGIFVSTKTKQLTRDTRKWRFLNYHRAKQISQMADIAQTTVHTTVRLKVDRHKLQLPLQISNKTPPPITQPAKSA